MELGHCPTYAIFKIASESGEAGGMFWEAHSIVMALDRGDLSFEADSLRPWRAGPWTIGQISP